MTPRQRENLAKYLYDISKGVVLIVGVGGVVSGQVTAFNVILGLCTASVFLLVGFWLDGVKNESG
jgi:hypothetical protein